MQRSDIIIVGEGPVGLTIALMLGRAGREVQLFEQGDVQHQEPRASTLHAATLDMLDDLGVYDAIEPLGDCLPNRALLRTVDWRVDRRIRSPASD